MESMKLLNCNLHVTGIGRDTNGNKLLKLKYLNSRGFSIQMVGNLPKSNAVLRGLTKFKDIEELSSKDFGIISREVCSFIKKHGTANQKKKLRVI